jgi:hypothetical protein
MVSTAARRRYSGRLSAAGRPGAPIPIVTQFIESEGEERRFVPNAEVDKGVAALLDAVAAELSRNGAA